LEPTDRSPEDSIRSASDAGDFETATSVALRAYGPEILGWLVHRLRSETDGADAFALFAEDLWKSWAGFQWRCSVRGWCYILARNAGNRAASSAGRDRRRQVAFSEGSPLHQVAMEVRTSTLPHLRTTVKDQFRELREKLSEEDQMILVLRVDKQMAWTDIAHVFLGGSDEIPGDAAVTRESARLRKRLQKIKDKLRSLGEEAGLL
jgi:RNA polymerase sigma-70 factor (ECF subfamily)